MEIDKQKFLDICSDQNNRKDLEIFLSNHTNQINKYDLKELVSDKLFGPGLFCEGLYLAARNNNKEIVLELLENDYSKKFIDLQWSNSAALRVACKNGHLEIVKILLEDNLFKDKPKIEDGKIGARFKIEDLSLKREGYGTPLSLSADNGHTEIVKYILTFDKAKKIKLIELEDSFKRAVGNGSVSIVDLIKNEILERKNGYDFLDKFGGYNKSTFVINTVLITAMSNKQMDMVVYLMKEFHYKHYSDFNLHVSAERRDLNNELKKISENLSLYEKLNKETEENQDLKKKKLKI